MSDNSSDYQLSASFNRQPLPYIAAPPAASERRSVPRRFPPPPALPFRSRQIEERASKLPPEWLDLTFQAARRFSAERFCAAPLRIHAHLTKSCDGKRFGGKFGVSDGRSGGDKDF